MTLTLYGNIQCSDGRFKVSRSVPDHCRLVAGEKIRFERLTVRVDQVTWIASGILEGLDDQCAEIALGFDATKMTREDAEVLFHVNGFEVQEIE